MGFDPVIQGGDKRRAPRVGAPKVVVRIPSADRFRSHYLKDLSEGGLFIRADRTFPAGSELTVELWPPGGGTSLTLPACIARVTEPAAAKPGYPAGMAVSFINLGTETQERLRELIAEHGRPVVEPAAEDDPLGQVQQLVAELDEAREQLSALSAEMAEARGQVEAYADQVRKVEAQEAEARATATKSAEACAALELENQRLRAEIDAAQARERELGKLLSGVSKKVATGKHAPVAKVPTGKHAPAAKVATGKHAPAAKAPPPSPRSEPPAEIVMPAAKRPPPPPPGVTDSVDLAFDALIDGGSSAGASETLADESLFEDDEELDIDVDPGPNSRPTGQDDELASFLSVGQGTMQAREAATAVDGRPASPPVVGGMAGFVLESSIADGRVGYETFSKKIKLTTRLMPTEALETRKPSNADEALLSELLGAAPTFETLLNQMGGQMKDLRLRQMLYELYARALVDLREG
jgi:uncharacterized protein (TIGR02266 family)